MPAPVARPEHEGRTIPQVHQPAGQVSPIADTDPDPDTANKSNTALGVSAQVDTASQALVRLQRSVLAGHQAIAGLQVPTPQAQARAQSVLGRWAAAAGAERTDLATIAVQDGPDAALPPTHLAPHPLVQNLLPAHNYARFVPLGAQAPPSALPPSTATAQLVQARPPANAASIRPAAQRGGQPAELVPQKLLQSAAEAALMWSGPSGQTCFRLDFAGELFANTACIITVSGPDIAATFYVADVNARRLLEAEQRRLQDNLQARGLARAKVQIVMGAPPEPFVPLEPA